MTEEHRCAVPLTAEPVGTRWICPGCCQQWMLKPPGTRIGDWAPVVRKVTWKELFGLVRPSRR